MKQTLLFIGLILSSTVFGQFMVTTGQTPAEMASAITGNGVVVTNATMNCDPDFYGLFDNAPGALGFSNGIVLGSGEVTDIPGSNAGIVSGDGDLCVINGTHQDPDLGALIDATGNTYKITEPCVLEFDASTKGDTLRFRYVFGSEEYTSFVCNGFNDIFGFFVSGPNPLGGMYVNENIALIPGTNTPVAINTVNDGTPNGGDAGCQSNNTAFYNGVITGIIFEGNTVVLDAILPVVPCATYHYKLAIADAGDCSYDSGVFIEAGSLVSNATSVLASTVLGQGFNTAVEGCVNGQFTFTLEEASTDSVIDIIIGGTATNGVDYTLIYDTIDFAGDTTYTVIIETLLDGVIEGDETIVIYSSEDCQATDSAVLVIADFIPLEINPTIDSLCLGDSINVVVTGAQTYNWSPASGVSDPQGDDVFLYPDTSTVYSLTYGLGTCFGDTTVSLEVSALNVVDVFAQDPTCPGSDDGFISLVLQDSIAPLSYLWSNNETTAGISNLISGNYSVTVTDGTCSEDLNITLIEPVLSLDIITPDDTICLGDEIALEVMDALSANASYDWTPGGAVSDSTIKEPTAMPDESVSLVLTGTNPAGCTVSDTLNIEVVFIDIEADYDDTIIVQGSTVDVGVNVVGISDPNATVTYTWSPTDFLADTDLPATSSTPESGITYTITAAAAGCTDEATTTINIDVDFAVPNAFTPNNDGVNDFFYPENVLGGSVREFRIYNNWGEIMHSDPDTPWDGTYSGVLQPQGVYFFYIKVSNGAIEEEAAGSFTLLH